ncbi:alpha/beta hydrolase [Variovorax sp. WS11]|uniref:alpha/beta hydrolase n=1 Tax=Variovorax sp. WS11 TaxID=1105204 RepID=UPI000D0CF1E5|nr:alpha/beta hydrolase [Variovorax sp. WS11]NDZ17382.1 alpha/beta hydrolase [Variovorax sp. WS11]PSL86081.1 alpha/beta hydrolase [Variovorax sp. WS11]
MPSDIGLPAVRRAARLDPEAHALLRAINIMLPRLDPQRPRLRQMRQRWQLLARLLGRKVPVARVDNLSIQGPAGPLKLRIFRPHRPRHAGDGDAAAPALLWFHGGGFVLGSVATADSICRNIAARSGAIVVTAQYRLAPEHALLAGREDSLAVLDWMVANSEALGIDATRIAVGGDSAGGNLAAVLAQRAVRRGYPAPVLQVLVYPATNLRDEPPSRAENAKGYLLTAESIAWFDALGATRSPVDTNDPLLSPALARSLKGLPPTLIVSAGYDPIRDDGLAYAGHLRATGVSVQLLHYGGQFHGFLNFDTVLRAARDALDRMGDALADAFAGCSAPDRTYEIDAGGGWQAMAGQTARDLLVGGLMWGEWLEQSRNGLLGAGGAENPLFNPMTRLRAQSASMFARLEVRETYPT